MTQGAFFLIVAALFAALFLLVALFNIWARRQPNHPRNDPRYGRMVDSGPDAIPFVPLFTPYGTAGDNGASDGGSFTGGGGDFGGGGADAGWSSGGGDFGGGDSGGGGDGGGGGGD